MIIDLNFDALKHKSKHRGASRLAPTAALSTAPRWQSAFTGELHFPFPASKGEKQTRKEEKTTSSSNTPLPPFTAELSLPSARGEVLFFASLRFSELPFFSLVAGAARGARQDGSRALQRRTLSGRRAEQAPLSQRDTLQLREATRKLLAVLLRIANTFIIQRLLFE